MPDAAFGRYLLQIGPAIGREKEWHAIHVPGTAGGITSLEDEIPRIAFRLVDSGGNVLALALGLNDADANQSDEEGIIGRPAGRRPFGDSEGATFGRPRAAGKAKLLRIGFPATITKLLVDEFPCRGFVEIDFLGGGLSGLDELHDRRFANGRGALEFVQALLQGALSLLSFLGKLLPRGAFLGLGLGACLSG
jgi:hypothetical protein